MVARVLIAFPIEETPGLRAEAAQLALGLAACGHEVCALGALGPWRHALRRRQISATEFGFTADTRKVTRLLQEFEPQIVHTFGLAAAQLLLPLAGAAGAGGVATLGHEDLSGLTSTGLQQAAVIFVPCDHLREQLARRLAVPVVTTGYLLPPPRETPDDGNRFLAEELGLDEGAPMVLLADTFHGAETEVALRLIEAAPALAERVRGIQLMIAGGGARLGELEERAAAVNDRLGYRAVLLPGHRDDIPQLLALATVAVGSGRFALEAVGAHVALVAAGAAGMIGAFTEETASVAHFTCCGRHGRLDAVTARALTTEIAGLFHYAEHREYFATAGQRATLAGAERGIRAAQIATYYANAASADTTIRPPQQLTAILPDDLRELLFALPAISALRAQYPLGKIRLTAAPVHQNLLTQMGLAEQVQVRPSTLKQWWAFVRAQFRPRADVCLSFSHDFRAALQAACSCAPHRIGFADGSGSLFFSDHLSSRTPASPERALALVRSLGISAGRPAPRPTLLPETRETVNLSLLAAGIQYDDPLILLSPQADEARAWPMERWLALAQRLLASRSERIAVLGATKVAWPEGIVTVMPVQDSLVMATLLARVNLLIAADSAPLQLANLLGTPTVGLYGLTVPETGSLPNTHAVAICHREYPCHPCASSPCPERHCLQAITPDEVADAAESLLRATAGRR